MDVRLARLCAAGLLACALTGAAAMAEDARDAGANNAPAGTAESHFETFLDRLMRAESNGRDLAANPRSTALGPFQFIKATFMDVARRHFVEVSSLSDEAVLALRTDRGYARRAAAIYSMESLAYLTGKGLEPSFGHLRLAHLVGPMAAARLVQAQPQTPAGDILSAPVIRANPFMAGMSASELIARSARDVGEHRESVAVAAPQPRERPAAAAPEPRVASRPAAQAPAVTARCNRKLVACRRWIAMQANKGRVAQQRAALKRAADARRAASRRPGV